MTAGNSEYMSAIVCMAALLRGGVFTHRENLVHQEPDARINFSITAGQNEP